ncbi:MAG: 3-hydroxyacyl-CoA dehydrogenase family protein [Deltaproteobacteria bacterium]|nr:MAG: 3-hydroxyacyl-CoA dehydrogenase family protein [Deltaproteobacteria bacterium]
MDNIAIIGAGTMGHALAQVFAQGGYQVSLHDLSEEILQQARRLIDANLDTLCGAGLFDPAEKTAVLDERITYTTDLTTAVARSELVVEAIVEDREAKKKLFADLDRLSPPGAILASNTSYLDIYQFVETKRPGKVIITHWFAPPHIVPLVEIVPGPQTTPETVATAKRIIDGLGKQTIVLKKFLPGFIANRLQAALSREVYHLLDNGYATPEDIDKATKASFGLRIPILGLVKRLDFTGLDLVQKVLRNKSYQPPPVIERSESVDAMVFQGRLGVKAGRGFYDYGEATTGEILRERDVKLLKLREFLIELGELD